LATVTAGVAPWGGGKGPVFRHKLETTPIDGYAQGAGIGTDIGSMNASFKFAEILPEPAPMIHIVDAGAADYETDPYASLSKQGLCEVIGFEPNEENCRRRNASAAAGHKYVPFALGDGTQRTFFECKNPLTSSLYRPNADMLAKFSCLDLPVVAEHEIKTHRLDDFPEIEMDYLKLDVQGAELDIIRGAPRLMRDVAVVHTEVEFIPLYAD
jgi:FkbM family methyltransferase